MPISLVAGPVIEPVTRADLKLQIGLSPMEDADPVKADMLGKHLSRLLTTARIECENRTRRAFITQTWQLRMDNFPFIGEMYSHWFRKDTIRLPKPPFQQVLSFVYTDLTYNQQNILPPVTAPVNAPARWYTDPPWGAQVDPGSETEPAHLIAPWPLCWPPTLPVLDAVEINFIAGYGDTGASVPMPIQQAILFLAHSYYDPTAFKNVDGLVNDLLGPYRNRTA